MCIVNIVNILRVPYTFNSRCIDQGIDAEVKIVQRWDSSKPLSEIDNLLIEFQTFLVDKKLKAELKENKRKKFSTIRISTNNILPYAERLLRKPILDYRKFTRIIPTDCFELFFFFSRRMRFSSSTTSLASGLFVLFSQVPFLHVTHFIGLNTLLRLGTTFKHLS